MSDRPQVLLMLEGKDAVERSLLAGVARYAREAGSWRFEWDRRGLEDLGARWPAFDFDAVVGRDDSAIEPLIESGIPAILLGESKGLAGGIEVILDDSAASEGVLAHFLERGFRHLAFLGLEGDPSSLNLEREFSRLARQAGIRVEACFLAGNRSSYAPQSVPSAWLEKLPKPVGLMTANEDLARFTASLCRDFGVGVPDECAIVAVSNEILSCELCDPPLTSIGFEIERAGYHAASILAQKMRAKSVEALVLASIGPLTVRQSSDAFAIEDPFVAQALRFLSDNADRTVGVDEVCAAVGVSRRSLEQRFQNHLSNTIKQCHRQMRASHIAKLLRDSCWSLEEVASQCGFSHAGDLTRLFKAVTGELPSAYRERVQSGNQ